MDSPMDLDHKSEGSQLDSQKEDHPFDVAEFNDGILKAINEHRDKDIDAFSTPNGLIFDDPATLLHIILQALPEECRMDQEACKKYLVRHEPLMQKLNRAYAIQSFADVLQSPEMPPQVIKRAQTFAPGPTSSGSNHSLQLAFEEPYRGDTAQLFIRTLNRERHRYSRESATHRTYNWSISVVQSSGMGKSRMVEEASDTVFTIPINIREALKYGKITYPPPDEALRQFFMDRQHKDGEQQKVEYAIFLQVLFTEARKSVQKRFSKLTGAKLALAWANYLREGRTLEAVGQNRKSFYDRVVQEANNLIAKAKGHKLSDWEKPLRKSCKAFVNIIQQTRSTNDENACFVYFDEAHSLTWAVQNPNVEHERSPYYNLGTVLSKLVDSRVFFIFLSTNSRLEDFAPPPTSYPSDRVSDGSLLITPFTEMPFDLYEDEVLDNVGSLALENMCKIEVMVGFGRTLWYAQHKNEPDVNVLRFALDKLSASGVKKHADDSLLAALGVRVGITFDVTNHATYSTQSRLVESHLRVVYSIPEDRGYMHTGSPSEPVLAEAAGWYLDDHLHEGIAVEGPKRLSKEVEKGFLARGERGELAGRLLVTSAHDMALKVHYLKKPDDEPTSFEPYYHRPIPVLDFLRALFYTGHHELILGAKSITGREDVPLLHSAFSESYVFFSHFVLAEDSKMLSSSALATALVRGAAVQAKDGQESIDAVIPLHMGSLTTPISPKTTSAINLQFKNRQDAVECHVKRSITVADLDMPVISIIFQFRAPTNKSGPITITSKKTPNTRSKKETSHQDDHHYQIVANGCSSATFNAIPSSMAESQYRAILGAGSILQDFPRGVDEDNKAALLAMKPALNGGRQVNQYAKRWS
ncbi:hypothetical protein FRC11_014552 [Ceratobasidium sp. 423]|nr:hypothetical protein FRC11_014552 [Ceratobasidium sp. 423]